MLGSTILPIERRKKPLHLNSEEFSTALVGRRGVLTAERNPNVATVSLAGNSRPYVEAPSRSPNTPRWQHQDSVTLALPGQDSDQNTLERTTQVIRKNQRPFNFTEQQRRQLKRTIPSLRKLNRAAHRKLRRIGCTDLTHKQCCEAGDTLGIIAIQMNSVLRVRTGILIAGRRQQATLIVFSFGLQCDRCSKNKDVRPDDAELATCEFLETVSQTKFFPTFRRDAWAEGHDRHNLCFEGLVLRFLPVSMQPTYSRASPVILGHSASPPSFHSCILSKVPRRSSWDTPAVYQRSSGGPA